MKKQNYILAQKNHGKCWGRSTEGKAFSLYVRV